MPHIHDQYDFTASAYIVNPNRDKVLLIHHKKYDRWMQVGGHIELNETPDETLIREVKEETGLEITFPHKPEGPTDDAVQQLLRPRFVEVHITDMPGHKHIDMKYVAIAGGEEVVLEESAHNAIRWFTTEDLDSGEWSVSHNIAWHCRQVLQELKVKSG